VVWSILVAAGIGLTIGYVAGRITRWAEHNEKLGETYISIFSTALALFTLAAAKLANTDGILAVFIAGLVFDLSVEDSERASPESVQEAMDLLFTMPAFILLGMALPWSAWGGLGWKAVVFPILIILFRRLPAIPLVARMVPP
jgi:NhaP-type Na+/H+ or K+/H+ antiporter